jgi:PAB-dependent poly(A)-specific ribonuclease subunit 3
MDEINSQFGRLSTSAAEWRPGAAGPAATSRSVVSPGEEGSHEGTASGGGGGSDLRAAAVKEFVPGQGWSSKGENEKNVQTMRHGVAKSLILPNSALPICVVSFVHFFVRVVPSGTPYQQNPDSDKQEQEQEQQHMLYDSTVPAGPTESPLPSFRALHSMGISDDNWRHHRDLSLEAMRQMDPDDARHKAIPPPYCNAYCLEEEDPQKRRSSFGYPSSTFQVTSREDGHLYCIHRFDNVRSVSPKIAAAVLERWTGISSSSAAVQEHPGIVPFYHCFVSQRAVFFVHQYIPGARTLLERLGGPLSEPVLWSCIAQLVSTIRAIHGSNLAARVLDLRHVLSNTDAVASRLRLRLNCLGIVDALDFESRKHVVDLQRQDIRDLGYLMLSLASGTEITAKTDPETVGRCEAFLAQNYSRDLHNLAMTLIRSSLPTAAATRSSPPSLSIVDVSRAVAQIRSFDEQDAVYRSLDLNERLLSAEYESGRALRLMLKLGFVNERPEFGPNRRWSQSGDCYVLTLFRDYVFHQADGAGNPIMNLGHVMSALNKLDAADEEKIVLSSRDGKSLLVVSYADVARCLENAFAELCSGSVPPSALQY